MSRELMGFWRMRWVWERYVWISPSTFSQVSEDDKGNEGCKREREERGELRLK
jgi:hypothetical protein